MLSGFTPAQLARMPVAQFLYWQRQAEAIQVEQQMRAMDASRAGQAEQGSFKKITNALVVHLHNLLHPRRRAELIAENWERLKKR